MMYATITKETDGHGWVRLVATLHTTTQETFSSPWCRSEREAAREHAPEE